jgi:hypothetical protein
MNVLQALRTLLLSVTIIFGGITTAQAHTAQIQHQSQSGQTKVETLCEFAPKNDLYIPENKLLMTGIEEAAFNQVIDEVSKHYAPIVKKAGATLKVNRLWSDGTVNASAQRSGKTWIVNMYGGLARHEITTVDGFALVLCHELGHHLGGFPRKSSAFGNAWAANEGQSDYFATMKCFRRVYGKQDNMAVVRGMNVPEIVTQQCSQQHKSSLDIAMCQREAMAGKVLADLLGSLGGSGATAFDKPDASAVSATNHNHPKAQCRLDTYFAGSVCGKSFKEDFSMDAAGPGACAKENGDTFGVRPLCWYKPSN